MEHQKNCIHAFFCNGMPALWWYEIW